MTESQSELKLIGKNIKLIRNARGFTQFALANKAGMTRPGTISDIENAKIPTLNFDVLERLAGALDVTIHDLTRPSEPIRSCGIKSGLTDLIEQQSVLLTASEARLGDHEIEILRKIDLDLTSEGYLILIRCIRTIQQRECQSGNQNDE